MIEELFGNIEKGELEELWPSYKSDEQKIDRFVNTNIRHANIALNSILNEEVKECLERLFLMTQVGIRELMAME